MIEVLTSIAVNVRFIFNLLYFVLSSKLAFQPCNSNRLIEC